jgi:hypothetical protein
VSTPSSAPIRNSPKRIPVSNRCSSAVARPQSRVSSSVRAAPDPVPPRAASRSIAASTSVTVREA